ncbi:MAG: DNA repair protein RecN [Pseudomonadota bacterium]
MLSQLAIQDIVLIDRLTLDMEVGLTALTGETGAGKSILLDSLSLAVGAKADKGLVRHGADKGAVAATFEVGTDHPAWALLDDGGLSTEDDTITLRRVQLADGRSRAFINDQACSIGLLRAVGETLLEIHGQHQSLGFLNSAAHRPLLDQYAGVEKNVRDVQRKWRHLSDLRRQVEMQEKMRDDTVREADYLRHVASELSALAPEEGEEAILATRRAKLQAAERIADDLRGALEVLEEGGPTRHLSVAAAQIDRASARLPAEDAAPLSEAVARLDGALEEFAEARMAVVAAADAFVQDPDALNEVEERLFALRAAGRKFSRAPDRLKAYQTEVTEALLALDEGEARFDQVRQEVDAAMRLYQKAAADLSEKRCRAAQKLDAAVKKELGPLKLGHALFQVEVKNRPEDPGEDGTDEVAFTVSTNPGTPLGPLTSIASGGELSRFVLALKAVLVARHGKAVIIFDEVDSGVGGAVASAIGERLAKIAADGQVLVVTHSPQVAARAKVHWRVSKSGKKAATTSVTPLDKAARTEEIARMLSGEQVTEAARGAARTLLAGKIPSTRSKRTKKPKRSVA